MKPNQARWLRIHNLFTAAVDLPPDERAAYLDKACGNDSALRQEMEALFNAAPPKITSSIPETSTDPSLLTQALAASLGSLQTERRTEWVGERVGPYRLTGVLGHGGGSTVYLAYRSDQQYTGQVAIKLFAHTFHDRALRSFRVERKILAQLNHPHIAKMLDAGETGHNHPYLVMEHVQGEPIDHYCDANNLTVKQRVKLFVAVCDAVRFAHHNLVVHLDLKPGNILINELGEPRLLDFGIARLMDQAQRLQPAHAVTQVFERIFTPEYTSPEQFRGDPISTLCDVYSLGVVLYELLCGVRPYQINALSQLEMERSICQNDPVPPSQMVARLLTETSPPADIHAIAKSRKRNATRLARELDGDLDSIIMCALRKSVQHRYSSMESFVADLRNYLDSMPVQARHGNWWYNAHRFINRHRISVTAAASVILTLLGTLILTYLQLDGITAERDYEVRETSRSEQVAEFMIGVFDSSDPFERYGDKVTSRNLLDNARERLSLDHTTEPEVLARMHLALGISYNKQRLYDDAIEQLQESLAIIRAMTDPTPRTVQRTHQQMEFALRMSGRQPLPLPPPAILYSKPAPLGPPPDED